MVQTGSKMNEGRKIDRREFIQGLGALSLSEWTWRRAAAQAATVPLQQLAAEKGLMFGSSLALKYCVQSAAYQQLFVSQCDVATPELHMKWDSLSSQPGVYNFGNADRFVAFCAANRMRVRGHTLVWHDALPAWLPSLLTPANGHAMMTDHIHKVAGHFAGKLYSWDVVNEVLDPASHRPDGLRNTLWLENCGVDYLEQAFRATAAADPSALLVWNENYLELSNGFGSAKRSAMLSLLDGMLARGVPIHGVGLEAHLRAEQATVLGDASYEAFLGELARRGMKIFVTELDVQDVTLPADAGARDQAVAQIYSRFLSATLRQPAVRGVVTWGLADSFSWIAGYRPRTDGLPVRPLPFDANFQPKAAYYAIAETLQSAPHRG
jgi:endo-1,4-beta-xylanase